MHLMPHFDYAEGYARVPHTGQTILFGATAIIYTHGLRNVGRFFTLDSDDFRGY